MYFYVILIPFFLYFFSCRHCLEYVSPECAYNFLYKQTTKPNVVKRENPKQYLDAKKCKYYYDGLATFPIQEEQLEKMIEKLVIAELSDKEQDEFTKIKIRIIKTAISNFKIKTTEQFYRLVVKVINLECEKQAPEKTHEQNGNLFYNKNRENPPKNFNSTKIDCYKSVLKNFKIKTIAQFDEILNKMTQLGFKTIQEAQNKAKTYETAEMAEKFCFYYNSLCSFINERVIQQQEGDKIFNELDNDAEDCHQKIDQYLLEQDTEENQSNFFIASICIVRMYNGPSVRRFLLNEMRQLIVLNDNICL